MPIEEYRSNLIQRISHAWAPLKSFYRTLLELANVKLNCKNFISSI